MTLHNFVVGAKNVPRYLPTLASRLAGAVGPGPESGANEGTLGAGPDPGKNRSRSVDY